VVIIGADMHVDTARFAGKALYETSVGRALKETDCRGGDESLMKPSSPRRRSRK
jgi:fructose-specific phosphotransferase system component IIB